MDGKAGSPASRMAPPESGQEEETRAVCARRREPERSFGDGLQPRRRCRAGFLLPPPVAPYPVALQGSGGG